MLKFVKKFFQYYFFVYICIEFKNKDIMQKYDVILENHENENGLFYVINNETEQIVSKGYKYSRYAWNIQNRLELGY